MTQKIPTAWLQLSFQKRRLFIAICGISLAIALVFMQLGLRAAVFDSAVALHKSLQGDIFLVNPSSTSLIYMAPISVRRLNQTLALEEIDYVTPIYLGWARFKNPQIKNYWRHIYVIGFDISHNVLNLPGITKNKDKLKLSNVVLFGKSSRSEFGNIAEQFNSKGKVYTELFGLLTRSGYSSITVEGLFDLDISFGIDGYLVTSNSNFLEIFKGWNKNFVHIGVVKLKEGYKINQIIAKIKQHIPSDVKVLTKEEFMEKDKKYWDNTTPTSFALTFGVVMGLIVGVIFVYQILHSNVSEHLVEYATLKAMGYKQNYLLSVVFQQSLILALLGYIPGLLISISIASFFQNATRIPINMNIERALIVLILAFCMCFISGAIAMNKLKVVDPADVF
ncbi:DevC protein [Calothrix sp. NIES-4071]|nr:DevC protein [Calothrix sp. NIES-4071]BAZ60051.1 DevC protein [Calothrix sp. NIES-4105]